MTLGPDGAPLCRADGGEILRTLLQFIAFVIALMTLLRQSGANLVGLFATSAVLTAVIGLALQDTLGNALGGLALQLDSSIRIFAPIA